MNVLNRWRTFTERRAVARLTGPVIAAGVGVFTFAAVLLVLSSTLNGQTQNTAPASAATPVEEAPQPTAVVAAANISISTHLPPGHVAIGVPFSGGSAPLNEIHVGVHVDVLASFPESASGPGFVGQIVSGAQVLQLAASGDHSASALLDVPAESGMWLGHLVREGVPLTYTVRTEQQTGSAYPSLTASEVLARLTGLRASGKPTAVPAATPEPQTVQDHEVSQVDFVAYEGVTVTDIQQRFGVTEAALRAANPTVDDIAVLEPGTELVIPGLYGFAYTVRVGDTWTSLSSTFGISVEALARVNGLPEETLPAVNTLLLIPAPGHAP
ncbi:MAG: LysM peptidoglycan-binding domain-containing protein [Chloroflexi bacterium]|nr:LysM peptidoglycan-binding domain-containing protein [Chloroflexota bacterium]MBV9895874.1 LysM peptidoglycan-binding domain-containing protein [Chloroflexota bacterium]